MRAGNRSEDIDLQSPIAPSALSRLRERVRVRAAFDVAVVAGLEEQLAPMALASPHPNPSPACGRGAMRVGNRLRKHLLQHYQCSNIFLQRLLIA